MKFVLLMLLCATAQAQVLEAQSTGTIIQISNPQYFGFGTDPNAGLGQPAVVDFAVNLNTAPTFNYGSAPQPLGFGNPNLGVYWSNPGNWIGWSGLFGSTAVPQLSPTTNLVSEAIYSQNEFLLSNTEISGDTIEIATIRADSLTPLLNGIGLDQSFQWNPAEGDSLSLVTVDVFQDTGNWIATATVQLDSLSVSDPPAKAAEPGTLALLLFGFILWVANSARQRPAF